MDKLLLISILILGAIALHAQANPDRGKVDGHFRNDDPEKNTHFGTAPNSNKTANSTKYFLKNNSSSHFNSSAANHSYWGDNHSSNLYDSKPSYRTTSALDMREKMSLSSSVRTIIPKGAEVKVVDSSFADWWEVYFKGKTGYVFSRYLTYDEKNNYTSASSKANSNYWATSDLYKSKPSYFATVALSLRENMSSSSAIIGKVPKGAEVKVINSSFKDWKEVYYNGKTGFISSKYLSDHKNDNRSSVASASLNYWHANDTYEEKPIYFTSAILSLREHASSSSTIITEIPKGAAVKVVNSFIGDWWLVHYNGKTGHIAKKYLVKNKTSLSEKKSYNTSPPKPKKKGYYTLAQKTSLRESPDPQSKVLLRFRPGDEVKVLAASGEWWWKVTFKGKVGWVKKRLLLKN